VSQTSALRNLNFTFIGFSASTVVDTLGASNTDKIVPLSLYIVEVGFGVANEGTVVITDWVDSFSDIDEGKSIVKLAIFGDSRTDDSEYMNWPDYTKKYLDGVAGIRVHDIYNYAVSGQSIFSIKTAIIDLAYSRPNIILP